MRVTLRWTVRSVGIVGLVAALSWWVWPVPEPRLNRDDNGLWLRRHWLHGGHGPTLQLVAEVQALGIRRLYPFLGPMDPTGHPGWRDDGTLRLYDEATVAAFFSEVHERDPTLSVMPWTGGVLQRDVVLDSTVQRAGFVRHMQRLVELGADGVHLNVEPLPSGHPGFLVLLDEVKAGIGPDATLSVAAYPPTTPLHPYEDVHWELGYLAEVCDRADEVVLMAYDTAQQSRRLYEGLVAHWVAEVVDTLPAPDAGGCEVLFGVPAYEDDAAWHRPDVETLDAGLAGVRRGLAGRPVPEHVRGVALYAPWTTDATEWATYDQDWRGRPPTGARVTEQETSEP